MTAAEGLRLRAARPEDYDTLAAVVDEWWGRPIVGSLPRLFLDHFHRTSLVAERADGAERPAGPQAPEEPAAFLVGLVSPSVPGLAHIHFVGVAPDSRRAGLGRLLYREFFALAAGQGAASVTAITSPVNHASIAFHRRMGFGVEGPLPDYDGPGKAMMLFRRAL
jgi:ribosomal protein S18 acetylase RimI-like enzyme